MGLYLISIKADESNKQYLINKVKTYKWAKITDDTYCVSATEDAVMSIRKKAMEANAKMLIVDINDSAWWSIGLSEEVSTWLKDNREDDED